MKAITFREFGGPEVLVSEEVPDPVAGRGEVLIDVAATAVNRADLLQRQGHYPPPPGASTILGLECSGRVVAVDDGNSEWSVGDEVCALLAGGGYTERVAVPASHVLPIPRGLSLLDAAALPEAVCTVWANVFMAGALQPGETFLCHGGSGGIGTMAIQLAKRHGARVFVTASSEAKRQRCLDLGADVVIDYRTEDFVEVVKRDTDGSGVHLILDNMGALYLSRNIDALTTDGRLVVIGMQGGTRAEVDLSVLMQKRVRLTSTALRSRSLSEKASIITAVRRHIWPLIDKGAVRPVVDTVLPLERTADAHRQLEDGEVIGKLVLQVR